MSEGRLGNRGEIDVPRAGLECWYYMSAVQNMSVLVDQNGAHLLGVCAPANTRLLDYVRIFVRYGSGMANRVEENPAAVALEALNAAFPCTGRTTAKSTKLRRVTGRDVATE
jgi:hypothetical protein